MTKKEVLKQKKRLQGIVMADGLDKTVIVEVNNFKAVPKYKKIIKRTKRYKVHDEKNTFKIGDEVLFEECRPLSRDKRWKVVRKIK